MRGLVQMRVVQFEGELEEMKATEGARRDALREIRARRRGGRGRTMYTFAVGFGNFMERWPMYVMDDA